MGKMVKLKWALWDLARLSMLERFVQHMAEKRPGIVWQLGLSLLDVYPRCFFPIGNSRYIEVLFECQHVSDFYKDGVVVGRMADRLSRTLDLRIDRGDIFTPRVVENQELDPLLPGAGIVSVMSRDNDWSSVTSRVVCANGTG